MILYIDQMLKKKMIKSIAQMNIPTWSSLKPLLVGGFSVQLRAVALNIAFLAVTRTTQKIDGSGVAAAAHAITIQLWQLGGVVLLAMSTVASIIVPIEVAKANSKATAAMPADLLPARRAADRCYNFSSD
jgi:Na+-driven multidrug efflux pump